MKSYRPNNNRNRFRSNDRNFKRNGDNQRYNGDFRANSNFQRRVPGKNNHNASKLIEKYNDLAKEALSNGDKILSENYFQHADHFLRIQSEQEKKKPSSLSENNSLEKTSSKIEVSKDTENQITDI